MTAHSTPSGFAPHLDILTMNIALLRSSALTYANALKQQMLSGEILKDLTIQI